MATIFESNPASGPRGREGHRSKIIARPRAFGDHRLVTRRQARAFLRAAFLAALLDPPHGILSGARGAEGALVAGEAPAVEAVFYNGTIYTMDASRSVVEAVAVGGGRIVGLGSSADLLAGCPSGAARIDLGGRAVIPGLTDAHAHFLSYAEKAAWADLRGTRSSEGALARVAGHAHRTGDGWALGRGWDQNDWPEAVYPRRDGIDGAVRGPAYLVRVCGHAAWVNTAALRLAGIDARTPDPPGGRIARDASGEPTGILFDNAMDLVSRHIPSFDAAEKKRLLREAAKRCLAAGLVGVHEMGIGPDAVSLYEELYAAGELPFRVTAYLEGSDPGLESLLEAGPSGPGGARSILDRRREVLRRRIARRAQRRAPRRLR